ncbi:MAG TPA: hypothetical protein VIL44_01585 [Micromonospora sp.]
MSAPHGLIGVEDAGAFLARLTRLDPRAVVRLRGDPAAGRTTLWARLPWRVLVARTVAGVGPQDTTVSAAELLAEIARGGTELPPARDREWQWALPPARGEVVERLAVADVRRVAAAAAATVRAATTGGVRGRPVGQRMLREALLDHVAIVVTPEEGAPVDLPQRLVQAVVRMGFLGPAPETSGAGADHPVHVRVAGRWVGLSAPYGIAWLPPVDNLLTPIALARTNV